MKAIVFKAKGKPVAIQEMDEPKPAKGQVIVEIKNAGLNHRDVWIAKGKYPGLLPDIILGSDGAGVSGGQAVIINPNLNWGPDPRIFGKDYKILGMPDHGTFAQKITVDQNRLASKPVHLDFPEASALPLGGLTAYRALFVKANLNTSDKVLISGIGGGVAVLAFQFALANGNEVYVTSGSDHKIEKAIKFGAKGGANYRQDNWYKKLVSDAGGIDVVIDSAGGDGFPNLVECCNPLARIVLYGGTSGSINHLSPQRIYWKQLSIIGSTMGNDEEFLKMVEFVEYHKIVPVVDSVFPLSQAANAFERMDKGLQFGKIVFDIHS